MSNEDYAGHLENHITDWFRLQKKAAPTKEARQLLERMYALIKRGGKRSRPRLLYLTYTAYGGKQPDKLLDLGLALEFHHQFLLVHDDLMDDDTLRYDGPNIVGYYLGDELPHSQNIAEAMGILAGDLLFSFAHQAILQSAALPGPQKLAILELINDKNVGIAFGQQLDTYNVDASLTTFSLDQLLRIHALKSSLYTTQLPMQCAAILLHLPKKEQDKIYSFSLPFGILFQLVDDYSDYFHNRSVFNNRTKYRDFRQGKITYPLYMALTLASKKEQDFIKQHLGKKESSDAVMQKIVAIAEKCGARAASREYLDQYFERVYTALDQLSLRPEAKQQFTSLIEQYRV